MFDTTPEQELATCCRKGDLTRATELLDYGVAATGGQGGRSYLALACEGGHSTIVELLLRSGARPTGPDLVRALRSYELEVAVLIADQLDALGVERDFWTDDRPLLDDPGFIGKAPVAVVRWMLEQGADPTERDRFGNDAVAAAQKAGASSEVLKLLTGWTRAVIRPR